MSQATTLYTNIRFSHKTYNDLREVERDLENAKESLEMSKATISKLCTMTEPQKYCGDENPMFWLDRQYNEALENIEEMSVEIYKLEKLVDEWDRCHDKETGLAIPLCKPADELDDNYGGRIYKPSATEDDLIEFDLGIKSFIDGDFIKTIYEPNGPELK